MKRIAYLANIQDKTRGLTLVELLVVLSIVAVLSTVALRSVVGTFEQNNYDANISQLEQIELAVLGSDEIAGFLGDIGRLPQAIGDADATNFEQLAELWDQSASGLPDYSITAPSGDSEVRLGTGWRGPYLNLGINRDELTDGFANGFVAYQLDGTVANDSDTISIIQSLGASGSAGGSNYEEDFEVVFGAEAAAVGLGLAGKIGDLSEPLSVTVNSSLGSLPANLVIRVYGADGSGGLITLEQEFRSGISGGSAVFILDGTSSNDGTDDGAGLVHGPKVIRVYETSSASAPTEDTDLAPAATSPTKSPITNVVVDRFTSSITLTLY